MEWLIPYGAGVVSGIALAFLAAVVYTLEDR